MKKRYIIFLVTLLAACSGTKDKDKLKEIDYEVEYSKVLYEIKKGNFYSASEQLDNINLNCTRLNDKIMILLAFSYYKSKQYIDSLSTIEFFEKNFPLHSEMVYMKYLKILNYFNRLEYVGKGAELASEGYSLCNEFLEKYKKSIYYNDVSEKMNIFKNYIVANELEVVRFNLARSNFVPALKRLDYIRNNFDDNLYRDEVYYRYIEIYKYIGYDYNESLINNIKSKEWKDLVKKL